MTKIPWTEKTWNPVIGCTKIATGCYNCYAEKMAYRLRCMGKYPYHDHPDLEVVTKKGWTGQVICNEKAIELPLQWKTPRMIFICSMSDLFHEKVPESFIYKVLMITQQANWHTYQILTKRIGRAAEVLVKFYGTSDGVKWPFENVWIGTSVSTQKDLQKNVSELVDVPAAVRYISFEPLLEEIDFVGKQDSYMDNFWNGLLFDTGDGTKSHIHWAIIGCESGPGARLCRINDIRRLYEQCWGMGVPVYIKQVPIDGKCNKNPDEWPEEFQIQEYPK